MADRADTIKAELVEGVTLLLEQRLEPRPARVAAAYLRSFLRDVAPGDLEGRSVDDLYGAALGHLRLAERRTRPGPATIRAFNPRVEREGWQSRHTVVQLVNDDMPFLVDSVALVMQRRGLAIHLTIHPVLEVRRDGEGRLVALDGAGDTEAGSAAVESFMHVEVDRLGEEAELAALEAELAAALGDVRAAVLDFPSMVARMHVAIEGLAEGAPVQPPSEQGEVVAFLQWLAAGHFIFLGCIRHALRDLGGADGLQLERTPGSALGIHRGQDRGMSQSFAELAPEMRDVAREPWPALIVTKATARSRVHRGAYLDVVSVKIYGPSEAGELPVEVKGEHRFLGLFTSSAYSLATAEIPLVRRKVAAVLARSGFQPGGHDAKALAHILEEHPRDELLQITTGELERTARGILAIQERQRTRLFLRRDPFGRFVTGLVFVPRDRFDTSLRRKLQTMLEDALGTTESDYQVQLSDSQLARLLFILRTPRGIPPGLDMAELERKIAAAAQGWADQLKEALTLSQGEAAGHRLLRAYARDLPAGYRETVPARAAVADLVAVDRLERGDGPALATALARRLEDPQDRLRLKVIRRAEPIPLSDVLPILERLGLRVLAEGNHELKSEAGQRFFIHEFLMTPQDGAGVDIEALRPVLEPAFLAAWSGEVESDGFARLVVAAGLSHRRIVILRAYCKYLLQLGIPFSQAYVEDTLVANAGLARLLVELFEARFDPALGEARGAAAEALERAIAVGLDAVSSLDQDRILRSYLGVIRATLRTNAFQSDPATGAPKPQLAFKLRSAEVPGMPAPRPLFEIWVYAPAVEAIHLRGGKVARGGIRWSDRREDFRTEVLGLMKAQMVKNSVIVPVGAKGGFFVKRPPAGGDRGAQQDEAVRCYKLFLNGLLDLTDNRVGDGIVAPVDLVRYDEDDPYLVVAADKGTATFSDIANDVAVGRGFWLQDAFASGGSAGYDHKGMGITARGAWESVRSHFGALGRDPQQDPFTCVGIGDMSGDVFGNGMLLSERIRLIAAFDHRHVFLDPDPDPQRAFAERRRLFALPRSSWADYDPGVISKGGGIHARTLKIVPLSAEIRAALAIEAEQLTPTELISAILKAPVDLLWNGGIGTYVKASGESHAEARDRGNDGLRVDGREVCARIVAEGGNLGLTQPARVEIALRGGRINTDFIDNSAGVDCSDHEVNIKILLGEVEAAGDLTRKQRDQILAEMTDEVGELVLRDNVLQNAALAMAGRASVELLDDEERLMRGLERAGLLDRAIEQLPGEAELAERRAAGRGLTRPEQAVLLAYAKMTLYDRILASSLPDRPYFARDLAKYFPRPLRRRFPEAILRHRLRRELVATLIANSLVNRGLHTFVAGLEEDTGAALEDVVLAFTVARDTLGLVAAQSLVQDLPAAVPPERRLGLQLEARAVLVQGSRWFLAHLDRPIGMRDAVDRFASSTAHLLERLPAVLPPAQAAALAERRRALVADAVAEPAAESLATLPYRLAAADIVLVAESLAGALAAAATPERDLALERAARIHFGLDALLDLGWLRARLRDVPVGSRWDRIALTHLEDQIAAAQRRLGARALAAGLGAEGEGPEPLARHLAGEAGGLPAYHELLAELRRVASPDLAMLSVATRNLGLLVAARS